MHARTWIATGVAALAVLAGCVPGPLAPTSDPTPGLSATPSGLSLRSVAIIPDVQIPGSVDVVAGTGTRFLIKGETDDAPGRYSLDNGRTWQEAPAALDVRDDVDPGAGLRRGNFIGYGGMFLGVRQEPGPSWSFSGFQRWDPATGLVTTLNYDLNPPPPDDGDSEVWVFPIDYVGAKVLLNDSRVFDVSGQQALPVLPRLPGGLSPTSLKWSGLTRDGDYLVGSAKAGGTTQLVIGPTGTIGEPAAIEVPGLLAVDVSASRIHYLVGGAGSLELCRAEVATPRQASCLQVAAGDYRRSGLHARLTTSDGADQIFVAPLDWQRGERKRQQLWFVRGGRPTLVATSTDAWSWLPYRDTAGPAALVGTWADRSQQVVTLADDGHTVPVFSALLVATPPADVAVSAGRVVYQQEHPSSLGTPTRSVWARTITAEGLGAEAKLTDRIVGGLLISGDRTAVQWDRPYNDGDNTVVSYDGLQETGRFTAGSTTTRARTLSGPYLQLVDEHARIDHQVVRVDGLGYQTGQVVALYGSLVVEASSPEPKPGRTFTVRDLARPDAEPIPLVLPEAATRLYRNSDWLIWGDWLAAPYETYSGNLQALFNYRTGQVFETSKNAWPLALGDGWVILVDHDSSQVRLAELSTGNEVPLGPWGQLSTDGVRTISLRDDQQARIAVVAGLPGTPPRLLGALGADELDADGKRPWAPQFDLTKPVRAGTIELTDSAGTVVQQIPTAAAPNGSIRGVAWDGRDTGGDLVPAGDYTWGLTVTATDGAGIATSADGLRAASGTLTITP